ncbi:MAG: signal peptide peptidase SppA [Spirochaetes bacterium]|nr:signal peptide peptidase SppA [Spirochaetota bacterium]
MTVFLHGAFLNPHIPYVTSSLSDKANSIFFNPAGLGVRKNFNMFFDLSYRRSENVSLSLSLDTLLGGFAFENFQNDNTKYKIYHYVLPGEINFFGFPFYVGIKNSWYTIDSSHPYTIGLGFLNRFWNHFSLGMVFDNLNRMKIYPDRRKAVETKLSLGFGFFSERLFFSIENVNQDNFGWDHNVYQLFFEPIKGIRVHSAYFNLLDHYTYQLGMNFLFSQTEIDYSFNNVQKKDDNSQSLQIGYDSSTYPSELRIPGLINIKVEGLLTDAEQMSLLGDSSKGAQNIAGQIEKGINDDKIRGMLLEIGSIETTSFGGIGGLVYELRDRILEFRKKGKYVVAYLESGGSTEEYFLASAADKIVCGPFASLEEMGIALKVRKFKGLLQKIGIKFDIISAGEDKNALNPFGDDLEDWQRESLMENVRDSYHLFVKMVSDSRFLKKESVENLMQDQAVLSAKVLKQENWIDKIGYREDAMETLGYMVNRDVAGAGFINIENVSYRPSTWKNSPKIAVIPIYGPIVSGKSIYNRIYGNMATGSDTVVEQIQSIEGDVTIKAVIMRIDTPGGSVSACDRIYKRLLKLQDSGKYIVASFGSMATSGGYYIACGANKIISTPFTVTGSIGVFTMKPVLGDLYEKFDITSETLKKGPYSDSFTSDREFSDKERESIKENMEEAYDHFISVVAKNRDVSPVSIRKIARGRIYTGNRAFQLKLVDHLGGMKKAVDIIQKKTKIDDPIMIYYWQDFWSFSPVLLF